MANEWNETVKYQRKKKIDGNLCVCRIGKISSQFKPNLILSPILPEIIRPVKNRENSKSNYVEECWKGINQQSIQSRDEIPGEKDSEVTKAT